MFADHLTHHSDLLLSSILDNVFLISLEFEALNDAGELFLEVFEFVKPGKVV